jgi:hypothetical protein
MMEPVTRVPLRALCHARSGDKGNRANIGVVCDSQSAYEWLVGHLTEEFVRSRFQPLGVGAVKRYLLPNICAMNFVLESALGGGASRSLRLDTQGKALATVLMELEIAAPPGFGS